LTFGDNLLDFNLEELSQAYFTEKRPLMVCTSYKEPEENFNVRISGTFVYKYDKRYNSDCSFMDYGYSVFELNNFKELQLHQAVDLEKVIQELVVQQKLIALTTSQEYFEIGTPEGLERTINWLSRDD
jgi:NDP-sugar pyrophosphorylase family protein